MQDVIQHQSPISIFLFVQGKVKNQRLKRETSISDAGERSPLQWQPLVTDVVIGNLHDLLTV